jgi:hypothetical protein
MALINVLAMPGEFGIAKTVETTKKRGMAALYGDY